MSLFCACLGKPAGVHEVSPEEINVTFDDVRGCDEAKQELMEVVDFLTNPEKYSALGGKLPKGCLLVSSRKNVKNHPGY